LSRSRFHETVPVWIPGEHAMKIPALVTAVCVAALGFSILGVAHAADPKRSDAPAGNFISKPDAPVRAKGRLTVTGWTCYCGCCPDSVGIDPATGQCREQIPLGLIVNHNIAQCAGDPPNDSDYCIYQCNAQAPSVCTLLNWQALCSNYPARRRLYSPARAPK
jgi:hypothetical protein